MNKLFIRSISVMILFLMLTPTVLMGDSIMEGTEKDMALTRVREGGTPYNSDQSLIPRSITSPAPKDAPTSGYIESPPEYAPMQGVLYCFTSSYQSAVVRDLVVELTQDDEYDEIAYVWVSSTSQQNIATSMFSSAGANMSKVEFIVGPMDSIWMRDFGPHFIMQDGTVCIVDSHYYQTRDNDNFIPTLAGDNYFHIPTYDIGLFYSGGNFQAGPDRSGFCTELVNTDNPSSQGFNETFIAELYQTYQGIDTLHIMPQLPASVDGTGHIDMWMNIVDEDTVIISKFKPGSNPTAITITENAVPYMESLGFEVFRTPAWNVGSTHYTYTNAFRVNDRYFIPYYDSGNPSYSDEDDEAFANFSAAAGPDVEIIPIDCYDIIPAAGAIHCIVKQVPRRIDEVPAVHVIWPDGGEVLVSGTTQTIQWEATDTYNEECETIDLYYSTDGGSTYTYIDSTTDTGSYDWIVPDFYSDEMRIKVVATAYDSDQNESESAETFIIAPGTQTVYDFSHDAGVDRFCYGYQTSNWDAYIDGMRMPVTTEIDTLVTSAYQKIAFSDATGGDSDSNRYISTDPTYYYESTHVYEFTVSEDPSEINAMDVLWEGYADYCTQMEMYIWDVVEEQWCDGDGLYGQNRFMDNWAGNIDGLLEKQLTGDLSRYIDEDSIVTFLVYAERGPNSYAPDNPSFHDYISLTISQIETGPILSIDPSSYDFQGIYESETDSVVFEIWNEGSGLLNYTLDESCGWVSLSTNIGNSTGEHDPITVMVNTTGLPYGPYHCDILISSDVGTEIFEVDMTVVASGTPIIDVDQSVSDRGFPVRHAVDGDWAAAQSFTSSMTTFSSAEVYLRSFGMPEFDMVVELREDHPQGTLVDSLVFTPAEVSTSWGWFNLDFADTAVTPGTEYFIVIPPAPSGVTSSFGYEWGYAFGDQYPDGAFWFTRDGGVLWRDLPTTYEFAFKTYGIN
jgi:agmatine deiminase